MTTEIKATSNKNIIYINIIILIILNTAIFFITYNDVKKIEVIINSSIWTTMIFFICFIHNTFLLKKLLVVDKKNIRYLFILPFFILLSTLIMYYTTRYVNQHLVYIPEDENDTIFAHFIMLLFWLPISSAFYLAMRSFIERREKRNIETEKLKMEISFLKSQINPHFFFNTLNNLYGLALENSPKTPEMIIKLSELMHYNTYESAAESVSIEKEINCIETYVELKKMSLTDFSCTIEKVIFDESIKIAPKILINYVENAFKHGAEKGLTNAFIEISITTQDKKLIFSIKNNYMEEGEVSKSYGIGLENAKKQLSLIYPGKYALDVQNGKGVFKVILHLNCS